MAVTINNVVKIIYLTKENAAFYKSGDFIGMRYTDEEGNESDCGRVYFHRLFPYTELWTNISVMDKDSQEFGIIANIDDSEKEDSELIRKELLAKYFVPKIKSILTLKEKLGYSSWTVDTDAGVVTFTVRDTFRSMIRIGESRIYVIDNDGNRYEIENYNKLDKKSYKKIELYI